ncbi:hypothetical protein [Rathayibacter toxicus]|uniref:hypothetical protein n=1 Tax=Rathayibacter toxicus TaxID=145458 RepID=UPI00155B1D1D|nr:hypothetical protein [Rathayibacter toxicus]
MNFRATATSSVVVIDNYDSFVFTLVAYLRELEVKVEVIEGAEFSVVEAIARVRASYWRAYRAWSRSAGGCAHVVNTGRVRSSE